MGLGSYGKSTWSPNSLAPLPAHLWEATLNCSKSNLLFSKILEKPYSVGMSEVSKNLAQTVEI